MTCETCPHLNEKPEVRAWLWQVMEDNGQDITDVHPCHESPDEECRGYIIELQRRQGR